MILGIDPGQRGGIALLDETLKLKLCKKIPIDNRGYVSLELYTYLSMLNDIEVAFIEIPQMRSGNKGNKNSGANYGRLTAFLDLAMIDFREIRSAEWTKFIKAKLGIKKYKKSDGVMFCDSLGIQVPMTSNRVNASPHDGISDAICIAAYGVSLWTQ